MIPKSLLAAAAAVLIVTAAASHAEDAPAHPEGAQDGISLELNKLEPSDKGCKAYVVASNPTTTSYSALRLDLVMFQTDGVIGRRRRHREPEPGERVVGRRFRHRLQ